MHAHGHGPLYALQSDWMFTFLLFVNSLRFFSVFVKNSMFKKLTPWEKFILVLYKVYNYQRAFYLSGIDGLILFYFFEKNNLVYSYYRPKIHICHR